MKFVNLEKYFLLNNYKEDLFNLIHRKFLFVKQRPNNGENNFDVPKLVKYIKMPFYGRISYEFRKNTLNLLRNSFPSVSFRVVFTNEFKIGSFFNCKDRVPTSLCSNIVYKFTCPCCQARYIGCTSRSFRIRMFEHMGKSFRSGNFLQKMPFSAIRDHSHKEDHPFSDRNFEIIARFRSNCDALVGEKLLIKDQSPEINQMNNFQ